MKQILQVIAAALTAVLAANVVQAQLTLSFSEDIEASETTVEFGGSASAPLSLSSSYGSNSFVFLYTASAFGAHVTTTDEYWANSPTTDWSLLSGSLPWSVEVGATPTSLTGGGGFYLQSNGGLILHSSNTSAVNIGETMNWNGSLTLPWVFDNLGLSEGAGTFTLGNGTSSVTINWTATASAVPEPASFAIILGALSLGLVGFRRRRGSKRVQSVIL